MNWGVSNTAGTKKLGGLGSHHEMIRGTGGLNPQLPRQFEPWLGMFYIFTRQFRANERRSEGADIVDFLFCDGLLSWRTKTKPAMRITITVIQTVMVFFVGVPRPNRQCV